MYQVELYIRIIKWFNNNPNSFFLREYNSRDKLFTRLIKVKLFCCCCCSKCVWVGVRCAVYGGECALKLFCTKNKDLKIKNKYNEIKQSIEL